MCSCIHLQYNAGTLVIRFNNSALVPTGVINVEVIEEDDDDGEEDFLKWLIPAVAAPALILLVLIAVLVSGQSHISYIHRTSLMHFWNANSNGSFYICRWGVFTSAAVGTRNLIQRYQLL